MQSRSQCENVRCDECERDFELYGARVGEREGALKIERLCFESLNRTGSLGSFWRVQERIAR